MTDPGRRLESAARQMADQTSARIREAALPAKFLATVDHIDIGEGQNGFDVVWVLYRSGVIKSAGWNVSQTFQSGDRVMCSTLKNQVFVEYAIGGQP